MSAEAIGNLYAVLGIDTGRFDAGVDKAKGKLNDFGKTNFSKGLKAGLDEVDGSLKGLAGNAGALGNILSGLGIGGVAVAAGLAVAFNGARDAMAFGDDIADTANKLKVTTDYLQEMRFAAHGLGGDFKDADDAIEAFTKNFGLATSGLSAKAVKPFEALGLDPKSFATTQDALDAVIAKIGGLGSAAEQAAVADKLGLTPLLPALREGTSAIDEMRQAAHDIGYVMDAELIEKAGSANDEFESLTKVLDIQFKSAMVEAIPLVMNLTKMMVDGAKAAGEFGKTLGNFGKWVDEQATTTWSGDKVQSDRDKLFQGMLHPKGGGARAGYNFAPSVQIKTPQALPKVEPKAGAPENVGQLKDLQEANERVAATRKAAGEAARAAAAAERARAAVLKAEADAMHDAEQRSADYLAGLMEEVGTMGMTTETLKRRRAEMEAAAAPTEALANQIRAVEKQRRAQNQVNEEAAEKEKQVNDQMGETIVTLRDIIGLGPEYATALEIMARDLSGAGSYARELSYGIDDIAHAINDNDWTTAFAGLAHVLGNVQKAFKDAKTEQEKFNAAAGAVQAVGGAVGGTGGAAISGAASGAMAGMAFGGPVGAVVGGILGGLGGIFGSSKAKKQAKAQAAAQKAAEEAQRQQQIADIRYQQQLDLLTAQGKVQEKVNLERQHELDALRALDASLVAGQQALYDYADANKAKAEQDAKTAAIEEKRADIQSRIDALTLTDAEKLAKKRGEETSATVALDATLGGLLSTLYGVEDATAAAQLEAQSLAEQSRIQQYVQNLALTRATDLETARAAALETASQAMGSAIGNLQELTKTLNDFAASLGFGDMAANDLGTQYALAKQAMLSAVGDQIPGAVQAFLAIAQRVAPTDLAYSRDVALGQATARSGAKAAADAIENIKLIAPIWQAMASGNQAEVDRLMRMPLGLPGFASGGSMTLGGLPGVDQNLLSLNSNPIARVSSGEQLSITPAGLNDNGGGYAGLVAEMRGLRLQVAELQVSSASSARSNEDMSFVLDGAARGAVSLKVVGGA